MKITIKIHNLKKFITAFLLILVIIFSVITLFYNIITGKPNENYYTYTVHEEDTLWDIANNVKPSHVDTREVVYKIKEINHIGKNEYIYPGQQLEVPIY